MDTSIENAIKIVAEISFCCSILHSVLPPWDWASNYPKTQKVYRIFVYAVGYAAMNARSTIFHELSINNPEGVNTTGTSTTTKKVPIEVTTTTETKPNE